MKFKPKTLQQQFLLFVLVPVALLIIGLGWAGFSYTRNTLFRQWGEATTLKLQRAAHQVDMELNQPKRLLAMLLNRDKFQTHGRHALEEFIVAELNGLDGVLNVIKAPLNDPDLKNIVSHPEIFEQSDSRRKKNKGVAPNGHSHHATANVKVTAPRYDASIDNKTISLMSSITTSSGHFSNQIQVTLSFDHLVGLISKAEWWQSQEALIVDNEGRVLASTTESSFRNQSNEPDHLPNELIEEMAHKTSGTVRTQNDFGDWVSGFYRLIEAPWTLVIRAPANEVLSPFIRFRIVYLALGVAVVVSVLLLIRLTTAKAVSSIRAVSQAAEKVTFGDYHIQLPDGGTDEIGELMQRFNSMTRQLEEGALMKRSLLLAQEVQQGLLPSPHLTTPYLEIAGASRYCDETGGDYFDYIRLSRPGEDVQTTFAMVGDVTGHGIAAALLMSTARALIRCRINEPGDPGQIITDVNRLLCADTGDSGRFITLFFLCFRPDGRQISWVRAGHDPALLYDPQTNQFTELDGEGIALGIDEESQYTDNDYGQWDVGQVLLISTDGTWEAENPQGERFGKQRLKDVVRDHAAESVDEILEAVITAVTNFRGPTCQADDITLVVIKRREDGITNQSTS